MHTRREAIGLASKAIAGSAFLPGVPTLAAAAQAAPRGPGIRAGHAMAYHAGAGAICLIGGDRDGMDATREQPWLWDGRQWTMRDGGQGPGVASLVALAADPERKSVLAFGGLTVLGPRSYGPPAGELWELDGGVTWRRQQPSGLTPGARHHHAIAFDSARGRLVMYGGIDASDKWDQDVWEWDRERWHRIPTATGPGDRAHHAMAYDRRRGRVVLRGGGRQDKSRPPDTWEWDGKTWHQAAAGGPGPGNGYRMAYDAERGVTVLFGGDTCLWDGAAWTRVTTPRAPASRSVHGLAYDPVRKRVVMYGGSLGQERAGDTWEWDGAAWTQII